MPFILRCLPVEEREFGARFGDMKQVKSCISKPLDRLDRSSKRFDSDAVMKLDQSCLTGTGLWRSSGRTSYSAPSTSIFSRSIASVARQPGGLYIAPFFMSPISQACLNIVSGSQVLGLASHLTSSLHWLRLQTQLARGNDKSAFSRSRYFFAVRVAKKSLNEGASG